MKKLILFLAVTAVLGRAAVTEVDTGCGLSGGPITTTGTVAASIALNAQTSTYAVLTGDCGKVVTSNSTSAEAWTIAAAGSSGFATGWYVDIQNIGTGITTLTPATSTLYGTFTGAALKILPGQRYRLISDGTNYFNTGATILNGHGFLLGSAPTVSACGTGAAISTGSTDNAGSVTVGLTPGTNQTLNCTITFATAFTHAPAVSFSSSNRAVVSATSTTTVLIMTFSQNAANAVVSWSAF